MLKQFCALGFVLAAVVPSNAASRFVEAKSPGGIAFWYEARPDLPKAALVVGWRDGLSHVLPGKEALAVIAPAWMERGAGERSANELSETLDDLGAYSDLSSDGWRTVATLIAAPGKLAQAAEIERDILSAPRLEARDLDRIRKALITRNKDSATKGDAIAGRTAYRYALGDSVWTRLFDGTAFERINLEDVRGWRKRVLARDNMVVAVSGALSIAEFGAVVDTALAALPEKSDVPVVDEPVFKPLAKTIVVESEQPQTILMVLAATQVDADRNRLKTSIGVDVLGGGTDSRLFRKVRGELGAAYSVSASLSGRTKSDAFVMRSAVAHDKGVVALEAMQAEYARWLGKGIDAAEFEATRSRLSSSFAEGENSPGNNARQFVSAMQTGRPPNDAADYAERLASYTPEIVNAEIAAKFQNPPLLTVIVTPNPGLFKADCVIKDWKEADNCH